MSNVCVCEGVQVYACYVWCVCPVCVCVCPVCVCVCPVCVCVFPVCVCVPSVCVCSQCVCVFPVCVPKQTGLDAVVDLPEANHYYA